MCIIIDTNRIGDLFSRPDDPVHARILTWLERDGIWVLGGGLVDELIRFRRAASYVQELKRQGRVIYVNDSEVADQEAEIARNCRSNDKHVIAVARVSGARVLHTLDVDLMADFRNTQLVPKPKGKIYSTARHSHLLRHTRGCIGHLRRGVR